MGGLRLFIFCSFSFGCKAIPPQAEAVLPEPLQNPPPPPAELLLLLLTLWPSPDAQLQATPRAPAVTPCGWRWWATGSVSSWHRSSGASLLTIHVVALIVDLSTLGAPSHALEALLAPGALRGGRARSSQQQQAQA